MKDLEHKLDVLTTIAEYFNNEQITWAVGASLLLYLKGKTDVFQDIDIMIIESDVEKVKNVISKLGIIQPPNPSEQYKTKCFIECVIDDVDLDIMAGFVIVNNGTEYDCSLRKDEIVDVVLINNQKIPLHSLELWKYYYELMGRNDKVEMI